MLDQIRHATPTERRVAERGLNSAHLVPPASPGSANTLDPAGLPAAGWRWLSRCLLDAGAAGDPLEAKTEAEGIGNALSSNTPCDQPERKETRC